MWDFFYNFWIWLGMKLGFCDENGTEVKRDGDVSKNRM